MAGAYAALEQAGYEPQNVAGTSAGAITAALIAAGYSADELREIIFDLDYRQFEDRGWEDRVPLVNQPLSILLAQGIFEGERFLAWMRDLLEAKGIETFAQLKTEWDDPKYALSAAGDRVRCQRARTARATPRRRQVSAPLPTSSRSHSPCA